MVLLSKILQILIVATAIRCVHNIEQILYYYDYSRGIINVLLIILL